MRTTKTQRAAQETARVANELGRVGFAFHPFTSNTSWPPPHLTAVAAADDDEEPAEQVLCAKPTLVAIDGEVTV